ncbi:MAG TPA: GNAT family N-acetyltransferase [Pseudonocardiaceae bacterium]|nr:GNAT family N-acetyltransferase [Pseudonocardiaceae bacterium]
MDEPPDPWPLWRLALRTPRLELRPDDDQGVLDLLAEARRGIHPPEEMPFGLPWTDAPPEEMVRNGIQFHWHQRATCTPEDWKINFLIRLDGQVIGSQGLHATNFAVTREVSTGSWIGKRYQGHGIGTEMRAAVLMLAFDHLGARTARSSAFTDNVRSHGVSRRLGYQPDGTFVQVRRGHPATQIRLVVTAEGFAEHRPDWKLDVTGLEAARGVLGIG